MDDRRIYFTGIDVETGEYLIDPLTPEEIADSLVGRQDEAVPLGRPRSRPAPEVDEGDLATAGWGVVLPRAADEGILKALGELLEHRRKQAGRIDERLYQELTGPYGVLPGDDARKWLRRQGAGPGPASPKTTGVPYYLLLVGSPEEIPYELQFDLSVDYAVGRIWFPEEADYSRYAANVVRAEREAEAASRRAVLFGVDNPNDRATTYCCEDLTGPLVKLLRQARPDWEVEAFIGEGAATRDRLVRLLASEAPSLLFTSSHGVGFEAKDAPGRLGALVCQEWRGQGHRPRPEHLLTAQDVPADADLTGRIAFHFACYTAGLPRWDSFAHEGNGDARELAPQAYLARLPQRLLSLERGALAVVGHVDRARGFSFFWPGAGSQPQAIASTLKALMAGEPVGCAAQYLSERYAAISLGFSSELVKAFRGKDYDRVALADLWTAAVDARSYVVLGDPAARLGAGERT